MNPRKFWLSREVFLGSLFVILLVVPVIVFGSSKQIFVDKDAKGNENGTASHPYHSISRALKEAKSGTEVFIAKGTYKENITIPKNVELFGIKKDVGDVVIKADNDDKPTVEMKDDAEINHITIEGGRHGVRVLEDAKAKIFHVVVKKSNRDGIHIDSASRDKNHRVLIDDAEVRDNDRTGIYAEKRDIVIINSTIRNNGSDGIDLAAGMKAYLADNRMNSNKGSGAKLILDDASIYGKKNSFRDNKREGMEVSAFGKTGTIELKRTSLINNDRYGVARLGRTSSGMTQFGNLSFGIGINASRFEGNNLGSISAIVRGF